MRSILPEALSERIVVNGKNYRLRPSTANVLRAMDALENERLTNADRLRLACWHLYRFPRPHDAQAAVNAAFEMLNEPSPYRETEHKKSLDLRQDAAMIYAAFRQQYGFDLVRECETLDWRAFTALLGAITTDTALGGIMDIRTMKLPRRNQHNGEQIASLQKQKMIYALRNEKISFEDGLKSMAMILTAMAEDAHGGE